MELVSSWVTARLHLLSFGSHMDLTIDHLHCDLFYLITLRASFIPPLFFPCAYHHLIHALIFSLSLYPLPTSPLFMHSAGVSWFSCPRCIPPMFPFFFFFHFCLASQPYWLDLNSIHERAFRVELLAIPP
jgi:hypothetical protein